MPGEWANSRIVCRFANCFYFFLSVDCLVSFILSSLHCCTIIVYVCSGSPGGKKERCCCCCCNFCLLNVGFGAPGQTQAGFVAVTAFSFGWISRGRAACHCGLDASVPGTDSGRWQSRADSQGVTLGLRRPGYASASLSAALLPASCACCSFVCSACWSVFAQYYDKSWCYMLHGF